MRAYDSTVLHTLDEALVEFLRLPTFGYSKQNKASSPGIIQNCLPPMMPYVHDATVAGTYRFYVPMIEDGLIIIK